MSATTKNANKLTPAERSAKAKAAWAKRKAAQAESPATETSPSDAIEALGVPVPEVKLPPKASKKPFIHIHFLGEGATFGGKVWYVGEELYVEEGDPQWALLHDQNGKSILLTEDEQWDKYKKVLYGVGPWPGRPYDMKVQYDGLLVDPQTKQPIVELAPHEIEQLAAANAARGYTK